MTVGTANYVTNKQIPSMVSTILGHLSQQINHTTRPGIFSKLLVVDSN